MWCGFSPCLFFSLKIGIDSVCEGGMREALLAAELAMANAGGEKWIDQRIDEELILIIE